MPNSDHNNNVRLVLGKTHTDFSQVKKTENDASAFDLMRSIRQAFQKPDISRIQLLSWMRDLKKARMSQDTPQSGRDWTRFMATYIRSNANGNETV